MFAGGQEPLEILIPRLLVPSISGVQLESGWFASPETWTIDKPPPDLLVNIDRFSSGDSDRILCHVHGWLVQWIEKGSNPFIHAHMYRYRFPQCIQDAYLSLSAYRQRTATNKHVICRIIEDRIQQLVRRGVSGLDATSGCGSDEASTFDALEYLARVQSLLVYQCISLFDGDIRLRHLAEQNLPVLEDWLYQLRALQARQSSCCGESLVYPSPQGFAASSKAIPPGNLLWYSWILAESTRRTWLVTSGVQGIYKLIRNNEAGCMGGLIFTCRNGFWNAPSAVAWEKQCSEVYAGMVRLTEVDKLLALVPPEEINDFAKFALEGTFGGEQMERWGVARAYGRE
ncbi:hypothetical protein N0V83_005362 [Neocucurbitaria cava]|uniref:Uncharacterized protein n=1 Tax=Neocucurbitaria cava TaxID=798079 RepID=A0A9W8Y6X5_9PLEO|nr:hypothetical protein N0V83_005362 [Neocucurbitaria cava]